MKRALLMLLAAGCAHDARLPLRVAGGEVAIADPLGAEDHLDLGRALAVGGDFEAARRELLAASRLTPNDPRPERHLGDLLLRAGLGDEAEIAYRRSIARRATPEALNNLAIALLDRGAALGAMALATRALTLATSDDERAHIADTLARAQRAATEPEAPVTVTYSRLAAARFAYSGRVYGIGRLLEVVGGVPPARDAAVRARTLRFSGQASVVAGGCLLGTGITLLFTHDDHWLGGSLLGGGALLVGVGVELQNRADRSVDTAAALYNARVRTIVVPLAVGQF